MPFLIIVQNFKKWERGVKIPSPGRFGSGLRERAVRIIAAAGVLIEFGGLRRMQRAAGWRDFVRSGLYGGVVSLQIVDDRLNDRGWSFGVMWF